MSKVALVSGVTGQDGSYLADYLLSKNYEVHGIIRRSSSFNTARINHLIDSREENKFYFHHGDITDFSSLNRILDKVNPDEIYNLAAQSHVKVSFEIPDYTAQVGALGALRLLEAIRIANTACKFYQASTSELFGKAQEIPQSELTPFYPRSPYGVSKLFAYWTVVNYREAYGLHASNGILFNHESPRRGETFITRKVSLGAARIIHGLQEVIAVGNLDAKRDWGYAPEYVEGMWHMLQEELPGDYVLATGETHSVREFIVEVFSTLGMSIDWKGKGVNEKGIDSQSGKTVVVVDRAYYRPTEVDILVGNSSKAYEVFNWKPKVGFKQLAEIMAKSDFNLVDDGNPNILC